MEKKNNFLCIFVLMLIAPNCWAYGSSSSAKSCVKPKFTDFTPIENSEVTPGSQFSFSASPNTDPNSIKVTVKGISSNIKVESKNSGSLSVNGMLPASLKDTYARVSIDANTLSACNGGGGWLIKISK
jgi:hypothetical protein